MSKKQVEDQAESIAPDSDSIQDKQESEKQIDLSGGSVDDLADELIDAMPEVQEHVVNNHIAQEQEIQQQNADARDKRGAKFDPEIHAVEDDGSPKYTAAGYFAKKRGRKKLDNESTVNVNTQQIDNSEQIAKAKQRAAGSAAANTLIMLGVVMGGDEWQPIYNEEHGINEKQNLESAFSDYFEQKGLEDIPAGIALSIAICGYALPRFTMPKTQKRASTTWQKLKQWWINRKIKKHNLKTVKIDDKAEN